MIRTASPVEKFSITLAISFLITQLTIRQFAVLIFHVAQFTVLDYNYMLKTF